MYYMGIDGGGTKTRYVIANQEMDVLVDFESETIHIHQIGADELRNRLESHIKLACSKIDPTNGFKLCLYWGSRVWRKSSR